MSAIKQPQRPLFHCARYAKVRSKVSFVPLEALFNRDIPSQHNSRRFRGPQKMDRAERDYRSRPRNRLLIRHYVSSLMDSGRIIEASYFCNKLLQEAPTDVEGNRLAFLLAIKRMDSNVRNYDINLINANLIDKERLILHCRYYFAFSDHRNLRSCINAVMDEGISGKDAFEVVIESIIFLRDAPLTMKFVSHYLNKGIGLSPMAENEFKKILRTRLAELMSLSRGIAHA
ncbi:hypothetical protein L0Y81_21320 [Burkholderia multivorans]|uniref:hypothetical protein n=2 Tax=Burkholderia multivorans TaxID=87883 RepID=UPI00158911CE|nr:hypothetical protein [Burkholderia multivorans]MBR8451756.1 hypothetical protein [Burkholderia multivorans]MBU9447741.1 hypothetical protein [Burkholderia multivorans]UQN87318.1 hypothetical protein L0Y85_21320 [Burkholderia multivorans]UQO72506.1 hypothetical protein L0Y81_21320 [Burkholderia multivorans]UQP26768.1 hypothetical protein L0Y89_21315 [Burkholderia multivorans]